jgi:methionyl-tRNA formyltransferase
MPERGLHGGSGGQPTRQREKVPLRVIFMGTPDFSVPTLRAVAEAGHEIVAVYTRPPRPGGRRGLELRPSPVQREAERLGAEVRAPVSLKGKAEQAAFQALNADAAVVVAYGLLLPTGILEGTRLGCFNGHASLLPRWRGAAPIQRAIMAGDDETGMMIMKMDQGLDTGPVASTERVAIGPDTTAGELHDRLMQVGARLMVEALAGLEAGRLTLRAQPSEGVTYAKKIDKAETRIDWGLPSKDVHNHIRGLSPNPGAWCEMAGGGKQERLKLLRSTPAEGNGNPGEILDGRLTVACGEGAVRLVEVQRAGGKPASVQDFLRGTKLGKGTKLS